MPYKDHSNDILHRIAYYKSHTKECNTRCKAYYLAHAEDIKLKKKAYYLANAEKKKAYAKKRRLLNAEAVRISKRKYRLSHLEQTTQREKAWYIANFDKVQANRAMYRKTPKGREVSKGKMAKRRKNFGFIPLNQFFPNADAHHIDMERVIYIPRDIHQSVRHSVQANYNMDIINNLAYNFLNGGNLD